MLRESYKCVVTGMSLVTRRSAGFNAATANVGDVRGNLVKGICDAIRYNVSHDCVKGMARPSLPSIRGIKPIASIGNRALTCVEGGMDQ